jgi:hypothetical protein
MKREVAEFQGLYGPFHVSELVLQKIWLRSDFDQGKIVTQEGDSVEILFPGEWNHLEGPDFRNARFRINGQLVEGDVEVHFSAEDWLRHRHGNNRSYDHVVLHVVLFAPEKRVLELIEEGGARFATVVLLDLLWHDLEAYASDDALLDLGGCNRLELAEFLLGRPLPERYQIFFRGARCRWLDKVRFSKMRIARLGWEEACHQSALEVMGYRMNRSGMLTVATHYPMGKWRKRRPETDELLKIGDACWKLQGSRPANYPKHRLVQYLKWMEYDSFWPKSLLKTAGCLDMQRSEQMFDDVGALRQEMALPFLKKVFSEAVMGCSVGGTRVETMITDAFLPLLSAFDEGMDLFPLWFIWYAGDTPKKLKDAIRLTGVVDRAGKPIANGWIQGALYLEYALQYGVEKTLLEE